MGDGTAEGLRHCTGDVGVPGLSPTKGIQFFFLTMLVRKAQFFLDFNFNVIMQGRSLALTSIIYLW